MQEKQDNLHYLEQEYQLSTCFYFNEAKLHLSTRSKHTYL